VLPGRDWYDYEASIRTGIAKLLIPAPLSPALTAGVPSSGRRHLPRDRCRRPLAGRLLPRHRRSHLAERDQHDPGVHALLGLPAGSGRRAVSPIPRSSTASSSWRSSVTPGSGGRELRASGGRAEWRSLGLGAEPPSGARTAPVQRRPRGRWDGGHTAGRLGACQGPHGPLRRGRPPRLDREPVGHRGNLGAGRWHRVSRDPDRQAPPAARLA
jgi:hypothetical protein